MSKAPGKPPVLLIGILGGLVVLALLSFALIQLHGLANKLQPNQANNSVGKNDSSTDIFDLQVKRRTAADANTEAHLKVLWPLAELYFDAHGNSYKGFCNDPEARDTLNSAVNALYGKEVNGGYTCNDSSASWVASIPLATGGYGCIDTEDEPLVIPTQLTTQTSCL